MMRAVYLLAGFLVAFLLGGFVEAEYDVPWAAILGPMSSHVSTIAAPTGNTDVPRYSNVRGLEDAPRADTPQGATVDFERCVKTMTMRRESEQEARTVCGKIIAGISR